MRLNSVILAIEDELSEAISIKILQNFGIGITTILRDGGNAYLRQKAPELNRSAKGIDIFLLTDLDSSKDCPEVSPSLKRTLDRLSQVKQTGVNQ